MDLRDTALPLLVLTCSLLSSCSDSAGEGGPGTGSAEAERTEAALRVIRAKVDRLKKEGPKPYDKPNEAARFFVEKRLPEDLDRLPIEHLWEERARLLVRQNSPAASDPAAQSPQWSNLGPGNIGGRTRAFVIDPEEPRTMFSAGVAGGIWKTTDAGATWHPTDDLMLNLAVCSLVMDPKDSDVLYAGTGEGFYAVDNFVRGMGVFKSNDGGDSWFPLAGTTSGVPDGAFDYVNRLAISPNDSNRVYAATRTGLWLSEDAGQSWQVILANPTYMNGPATSAGCFSGCTEVVLRQDLDPDVIFATFGIAQRDGLYRSEDGGATWTSIPVPSNQGRMVLSIAPSNPDIMYMLMASNGQGSPFGKLVNVYRSNDGGQTFAPQVNMNSTTGPWLLSNLLLATGCIAGATYHQGWYDAAIEVDPLDPEVVWVGGVDLYRSDDGAKNFGIASYWFFNQLSASSPYYVHADVHDLIFHPDYDGVTNRTLIVTGDGGIYRTRNANALTSNEDCPLPGDEPLPEIHWESLNNGYGVTQFYHGDAARTHDIFIGGAQDNGTSRVKSVQTPNNWKEIYGGDGGYCAIDPTNPQRMYVEIQFFPTMLRSLNGGLSFQPITNGITDTDGLFIAPFEMDQQNPQVLWTGGSRPWRTTNGGNLWTLAGGNFVGASKISSIAIAPTDSNIVYMGFKNGRVARSTNALAASPDWTVSLLSTGLSLGFVSSVAVDPVDPDIAYCTYSVYGLPHVMQTLDGGQSWNPIDGTGVNSIPDIPVHSIAIRPCNPRELFVGTELGVFRSLDRGENWHPANLGLANTIVEHLDFQRQNILIAFTHGRGAYRTILEPCPKVYQDREPSLIPGSPPPPGR